MAVNPQPFTPKTKNKISSVLIMLSIAMFLGLVASVGIWQYLSQTQERVKKLSVTRAVVVAAKQIQAGTKITENDLKIKQLPQQAVPKDYPSSIEGLKNRIVKSTIQADEVVTESRLVGQGAAGGLTVVIPAGMRAITIRVNEVIGVGGFINPGDRVDILSVYKESQERSFSKTILQNVLVLAVGDKILDPNFLPDPQAKVVAQVTVALNPFDSEKLTLASNSGELHLVLRPFGDNVQSVTEGVTLQDVYGSFAFAPNNQFGAPPTSASTTKNSIEVILGNQRTYQYY